MTVIEMVLDSGSGHLQIIPGDRLVCGKKRLHLVTETI